MIILPYAFYILRQIISLMEGIHKLNNHLLNYFP